MGLQVRTQIQAAPKPSPSAAPGNLLQRKCACGGAPGPSGECEECRKKRVGVVQRQAAGPQSPAAVPPIVQEVLRSPGQPLDPATRAFMEPRFGHDFSQVRVHTDDMAAESARAVDALAYTVGRDVVFGGGQYAPHTFLGRKLLAHEIAHVVQQRDAASGSAFFSSLHLAPEGDQFEREAQATAESVTSAQPRSAPGFGHEFSQLRPHADAKAAESAQAVNARAYPVGQVMLQRSPRPKNRGRGSGKGKTRSVDLKSAQLVMGWILNIINRVDTSDPSRWRGDGLLSEYRSLLSLWYELTYGKKTNGSTTKLEGELYLSQYELAKAETEPILNVVIRKGGGTWQQLLLDKWSPKYTEFEKRADSEKNIIKIRETTPGTQFWAYSEPTPVSLDEFLSDVTKQNSQVVPLQRGYGIQVGTAKAGNTYYASKHEPRLLLWASPVGVFFMLDNQIYAQSLAGFSNDIILGAIIKAAQDVGPFVDLITAVVDIAISLTPVGFVYDLTMASKAIAEGNWRDAALQLLPGPAIGKATKLAKATRVGRAVFRGGAKGAKLLGKAIAGTASFVGKGIGKVRGKLKRGLWLVSEGAGEVGGKKAYYFLDEAEDVWRAVPEEEAAAFIRCSKCDLTQAGKEESKLTSETLVEEEELLQQPGMQKRKPTEIRLAEAREGQHFDVLEGQKYPHNQVPIRDKGGSLRRLDSYDPVKGEIISRKSLAANQGQIAFVDEFSMIEHFQEFALKYPNGATIAATRGTKKSGLANQVLKGKYVLEVPVQRYAIPDRILEEAAKRGITIRDITGKVY